MQQYAKAHFEYDNSLRAFLADVPHPIGTPQDISRSTDQDMQEDAVVAHKTRDDYANYIATMNAVVALWPEDVQDQIGNAGDKAAFASVCIFELGARTLQNGTFRPDEVKNYWAGVRFRASQACRGINDHTKIRDFQDAGLRALELMRQQLRKTQTDLVPKES